MRIATSGSRQPEAFGQLFCLTVSVWTTAAVLNFYSVHFDIPCPLTHPVCSEGMRNNRHAIDGTSKISYCLRRPRFRRQLKSSQDNHVPLDGTDLNARND